MSDADEKSARLATRPSPSRRRWSEAEKRRIVAEIPCPPAALEVSCPETPAPVAGDTWADYRDRVKAWGVTCRAAVAAWKEAHRACAKRP